MSQMLQIKFSRPLDTACNFIFGQLLHIDPGKLGFCFHHYCAVYNVCNYWRTLWSASRTCFFASYTGLSSSPCKTVWKEWHIKYLSVIFCLFISVCLKWSPFSRVIFYAVWCQLAHLSIDDCENISTSSYDHHQLRNMDHHPLLRVRAWNNGMLCISCYEFTYLRYGI